MAWKLKKAFCVIITYGWKLYNTIRIVIVPEHRSHWRMMVNSSVFQHLSSKVNCFFKMGCSSCTSSSWVCRWCDSKMIITMERLEQKKIDSCRGDWINNSVARVWPQVGHVLAICCTSWCNVCTKKTRCRTKLHHPPSPSSLLTHKVFKKF